MKADHTYSRLIALIAFATTSLALAQPAREALPFVSPMFGDHMVLQRDKTNTIWGWAKPGEEVRVQVASRTASDTADADGRWEVGFLPPAVGGPYTLAISGPQSIMFTNLLVGDVWICGGQSNMEWPLERARNGEAEVRSANHPNLRLFTVLKQPAYGEANVVQGSWKVCSPETVTQDDGVSAVGYFFAREIQAETNVPIALIKDCWGGTPAESWTSAEALRPLKDFDEGLAEVARLRAGGGTQHGNYITHWYEEFDIGQKEDWFAANLDDSDWKRIPKVVNGFADLDVPVDPAVCYFRKTVVLPDPIPAGTAKIHLGIIERMDTAFINDHWIGASAWVENPRAYSIANDVLKPGTNIIAVRVFKTQGNGGFKSTPDQLELVLGDGTEIALANEWKGKLSVDAQPPHPLPLTFENWPTMPAVLYNGMIAPVAPLAICGAIWYQGESNVGRDEQYRRLLPAMIADWREAFGQGDFPFYIVSLASFMPHRDAPGDDAWAELREAQAFSAHTVANSGLAVTIDVGDANDIHPIDKKPVGERLALCALTGHYGMSLPCSGPIFDSLDELPGALKLHFENTGDGLVVRGAKLGEFSVSGEDGKWHWADARIEGDAVVVSSPDVPNPKAARYAWQANPVATLYNGEGLPAVPFRTDGQSHDR